MDPGDTLVSLYGDTGIICGYRVEGFQQFLMGELEYYDEAEDAYYSTTQVWTQDEIDALFADFSVDCNWSQDEAYNYLEQRLEDIVSTAKSRTNELYVFSMDDEMTFGFLNLLEGNAISDDVKADLEDMDVSISAIGGMEELYEVMRGESDQSELADTYFDNLMSVYFSPTMIIDAIDEMINYLEGDWEYEMGDAYYVQVWIVDRNNADQYEGFTGH
ncbi:MAG: hypothetical protein LIO86_03885 [Lachnospiraceae bacterium]|nr:hypothetical protein [Lachnospiraceae bacterium]